MDIDLNKYSVNRKFIIESYHNDKKKNVSKIVAICGAVSHCPLIVLAFYLSEDIGFTPELTNMIDGLIKFYGYKRILGQREGSPYLTMDRVSDIE